MAYTGASTQRDPYIIEDNDVLEALAPRTLPPLADIHHGRSVCAGSPSLPTSPGVLSARRLPDFGAASDIREPCRHLFDLPQEMIDMIFDFAYPNVDDSRIKGFKRWELANEAKKYSSRTSRLSQHLPVKPYPGHKINDFLGVSKAFFHAAATAYIRNQTWDLTDVLDTVNVVDYKTLEYRTSFLSQHIKALTVTHASADLVVDKTGTDAFPALKRIEYRPSTYNAQLDTDRAIKEPFTEEDFEANAAFRILKDIRGLTKFSIIADKPPSYQKDVVSGVWEANMKKMETMLTPFVTQPKPPRTKQKSALDAYMEAVGLRCTQCTSKQTPEQNILETLTRKEGPRKESERFQQGVLERTDEVIVNAFIRDPAGFIAWAREMKDIKVSSEASK